MHVVIYFVQGIYGENFLLKTWILEYLLLDHINLFLWSIIWFITWHKNSSHYAGVILNTFRTYYAQNFVGTMVDLYFLLHVTHCYLLLPMPTHITYTLIPKFLFIYPWSSVPALPQSNQILTFKMLSSFIGWLVKNVEVVY